MPQTRLFPVTEASQVSEARRTAAVLAGELGLGETDRGRVATVATEIATNLVKHAVDGQLIVRQLDGAGAPGIELLALDRGPGMPDIPRCQADGFSTAGSPGTGLGAIARMACAFDIYSVPGAGTVLWAALRAHPPSGRAGCAASTVGRCEMETGAVCLPVAGETECGDAWVVTERAGSTLIALVDGLGHGHVAAVAARAALDVVAEQADRGPAGILEAAHAALRSTRGAAMAVAEVDRPARVARFCGVGNISGRISVGEQTRGLTSHNGTLGHVAPRFQEFSYPWSEDALLVMHSDGLTTRWDLGRCRGLAFRRAAVIAGLLYRDFRRERDDATVLVARETAEGAR